MEKINIRIQPQWTGGFNNDDPRNCPIAKALTDLGYTGVVVQNRKWSGLKWMFVPVGGDIPWDAMMTSRECSLEKQEIPVTVTVEHNWFYSI